MAADGRERKSIASSREVAPGDSPGEDGGDTEVSNPVVYIDFEKVTTKIIKLTKDEQRTEVHFHGYG